MSAAYLYDPSGRRTTKTVNGTATNYIHDGDTEIAEYDASGNLQRRFVPGPAIDQPIAMVTCNSGCTSTTKTMFHTDKLGSVVAMSKATDGTLATSGGPYIYDAYGNCTSGGSACTTAGTPYLYTGQRLDPETGLYYYRARYYSSAIGRFLQTDPIGYEDDLSWYDYVGDDPTDRTDPTGRNWFDNGGKWEWHKGNSYKDGDGKTHTSPYTMLLVAIPTKNRHGSTDSKVRAFNVTLYDQNRSVGTVYAESGGSSGKPALDDGSYEINLSHMGFAKQFGKSTASIPSGMQSGGKLGANEFRFWGPYRGKIERPGGGTISQGEGFYFHTHMKWGDPGSHGCLAAQGGQSSLVEYMWNAGGGMAGVSVGQGEPTF